MEFAEFFAIATGFQPYPYQERLGISATTPLLVKAPTGAGKTEAAVLRWLYRKTTHPDQAVRSQTPTRLVYCLPMRTLVEQTAERAGRWIRELGLSESVAFTTMMGRTPREQWQIYPEKTQIIVGTQDMLLSRALNRGYGCSPFAWPIEYGLLNNDCSWVIDEVQLMSNGLPTTTQLAGLRRKLQTYGPSESMWMSATAKGEWLDTYDHPESPSWTVLELDAEDYAHPALSKRRYATKTLRQMDVSGSRNKARGIAGAIAEKHQPGTLTLAVCNTVARAQEVYTALTTRRQVAPGVEKILVHSRFRAADRDDKQRALTSTPGPAGRIVVATQTVEAGVDISARVLVTELAPWASMVQRFGRCNRAGEYDQAEVFWIDIDTNRRGDSAPYPPGELDEARRILHSLDGQSVEPAQVQELNATVSDTEPGVVIRRRDVLDLFDTTPDLSGNYLDVSPYVRGDDTREVIVFWRSIADGNPDTDTPGPASSETVNVPLGANGIQKYLKKPSRSAWTRDYLNDEWRPVSEQEIYPGMILLLDASHGGYSIELGWNADSGNRVPCVDSEPEPADGQSADPASTGRRVWVTLHDHCRNVETETERIIRPLATLLSDEEVAKAIVTAALYHDAGKAHPCFQQMLRKSLPTGIDPPDSGLYAKGRGNGRNERRHFRHELGSAIAILEHANELDGKYRDLASYLAASHHGKIRMSIRSLPGSADHARGNPDPHLLLGYDTREPETLPPVDLGAGVRLPETELDMSIARIGLDGRNRRSWLERNIALLEWLGPFRLAYLEAIVRAADMRASQAEQQGGGTPASPTPTATVRQPQLV